MTQNKNLMFERVRLQAHLRTLIQHLGEDQALKIIAQALERELKYEDYLHNLKHSTTHSLRNHN